ncbi:MAG: MarR family transcriptional regulator [Eubacteriales bacterium]
MNNKNENNDVTLLAYELTYHRYLMNKGKARHLFRDLTVQEYITLHSITGGAHKKDITSEKIYLKDLSERLDISIHRASKMARELKERGLAQWSHDGNGSEGTYITITESGIRLMRCQEKILEEYYSRVIDKFGHDNLVALISQMDALEKIMDEEFCTQGDADDTEDTDE